MVNSLENYETLSALFGVLRKVNSDHIKKCTKGRCQKLKETFKTPPKFWEQDMDPP